MDNRPYQTVGRNPKLERKPLGEMTITTNLRSCTAGKILKNSHMGKSKLEQSTQGHKHREISQRRDSLQDMEMRRSDLLHELETLQGNIKKLKKSEECKEVRHEVIRPVKQPEQKQRFSETSILKIADIGMTQQKFCVINCENNRILEPLVKQLAHESELRTWKLKLPKQFQSEVFKVLQEKHKIPSQELTVQFDEFDPFVQANPSLPKQTFINHIFLNYSKCQEHWRNYAANRFQKDEVKVLFGKLDFDKQGTVSLKQLVREMSILLDRNLRARDLYRIFRRIAESGEQFTCTQFIKALAKKQRNFL